MKKLSVSEFEDFCKKELPTSIILHYENQALSTFSDTVRISMEFDTISVRYNPHTIKLSSKCGFIFFDLVKNVYEDEELPIGRIFHITCESIIGKSGDKVYTIVVR